MQCLIFVAASQGVPTDHLALLAKDTCVPAHGSIQLERQYWAGYHIQSTAWTACWNSSPVSLWNTFVALSKIFGLRGNLLVWYVSRGLQRCSQGMEAIKTQSLLSPSAFLQLTRISLKGAYTFIWSLISCGCHQDIHLNHLALDSSMAYACDHTELYAL